MYKKPKKRFEDSGAVDPNSSYYVEIEKVVNQVKQNIETMIDQGSFEYQTFY